MFVAITTGRTVLEVATNEAASLEGMSRYAELGYKNLRRIVTGAKEYAAYSHGYALKTELEVEDGGICRTIIEVA